MDQHELDDLTKLTEDSKIFSPKSDFVFKNIFSNKEVVTGFLKAILNIPHEDYLDVKLSNTFLNRSCRDGKYSILDLVITTKSEHKIDVEIQMAKPNDFKKQVSYYAFRLLRDQIDNDERYEKLHHCISIFILDYDCFVNKKEKCLTTLRLRDKKGRDFTDIIEANILELPKVKKNHAENPLYDWVDFFNAKTENDLDKIAGKSEGIGKAVALLKIFNADEDFGTEYKFWLRNKKEKY